jgi:hypothetical protein
VPTDSESPDPSLTPEQFRVALALSPEIVRRIDAQILSHSRPSPRKVALIVALTMDEFSSEAKDLPDVYYASRVKSLVQSGALVAQGDLSRMRYSEVWLPESNRDA